MSNKELTEGINLSLTISILLSTAINFFMDKTVFLEDFSKSMANWYGLTIIFLTTSYIILYLNREKISLQEIQNYHKLIMINLSFMMGTLFFIMYPKILSLPILGIPLSILLLVLCISANLMISGYVILRKLLWKLIIDN